MVCFYYNAYIYAVKMKNVHFLMLYTSKTKDFRTNFFVFLKNVHEKRKG